jgi:hypothetical protein
VKKYVQRLRRKLEDDAREPQWIASVHGVGYRFIGPPPGAPPFWQAVDARGASNGRGQIAPRWRRVGR